MFKRVLFVKRVLYALSSSFVSCLVGKALKEYVLTSKLFLLCTISICVDESIKLLLNFKITTKLEEEKREVL